MRSIKRLLTLLKRKRTADISLIIMTARAVLIVVTAAAAAVQVTVSMTFVLFGAVTASVNALAAIFAGVADE